MKNPWEEIKLSDYENHMKLDSVLQLQTMNEMMRGQFYRYEVKTATVLGIAGGNGLEHVDPKRLSKVYGVDINKEYLKVCEKKYPELDGVLECLCVDLTSKDYNLPQTDLLIANLLIEYIGYDCFLRVIDKTQPLYISCIIQINVDEGFVSKSPYLHTFDGLSAVHHSVDEESLSNLLEAAGFIKTYKEERQLPDGKKLLQLDFKRGIKMTEIENYQALRILDMDFGCDTQLALATSVDNKPSVRTVDAYYEKGSFYIITNALSDKMKQIEVNPTVALSCEGLTAHGIASSLGYICHPKNCDIADKLRTVFDEWYENGDVDEGDLNTIILRVYLTDAVLYKDGKRYDIDFKALE